MGTTCAKFPPDCTTFGIFSADFFSLFPYQRDEFTTSLIVFLYLKPHLLILLYTENQWPPLQL